MENGKGAKWVWLEIGADFIQPVLLTIGMCYLPVSLAWWGRASLGTYVFCYYFSDQIGLLTWHISNYLMWDATGLLVYFAVLGICLFFATFIGPAGQYLLISPVFLYGRHGPGSGKAVQK